jgi:hypothetical protein
MSNAANILVEQLAENRIPLHDLKLQYIYAVIKSYSGDRSKAARALQMDPNYLYKLVKVQGWNEFLGRSNYQGEK